MGQDKGKYVPLKYGGKGRHSYGLWGLSVSPKTAMKGYVPTSGEEEAGNRGAAPPLCQILGLPLGARTSCGVSLFTFFLSRRFLFEGNWTISSLY